MNPRAAIDRATRTKDGKRRELRPAPSRYQYRKGRVVYLTVSRHRMSSTARGIIGAVVCVGGFQLLKYGVGKTAGYVFAGITVAGYIVMQLVYQRRLARLRDDIAEMSEEERSRFLQEIDPEIAEDLRKNDDKNNG